MMADILIIIFSIIVSAFFSGMEIAYVSSNKLKLELSIQQKNISSRLLQILYKNPAQYITTMLIGNNIALVVFGLYSSDFIINLLFPQHIGHTIPYWILIFQIIISTFLILITAEFLPKVLFSINPNKALKTFIVPVFFIYFVFYPLTAFTIFLSNFIIRYMLRDKNHNNRKNLVFGKIDLNELVSEDNSANDPNNDNTIDNQDIKIFKNVLEFSDIKVTECLVPRTEIVAIDIKKSVEEMKNILIQTGHSRIIIFKDNIDNIIGYIHSSVLFRKPKSIKAAVTSVPIVPEFMTASKVLRRLNDENKGIAVIVDEFGGTEGIVTQEDIMEEIFGEIEDEHDKKILIEQKISDTEYVFAGRQEIDYINDKYNLDLPSNDSYETIAGLILDKKGDIPHLNEELRIDNSFRFKILEVSDTKIEKVHITKM